MKKIISILLFLQILFILCSCNFNQNENNNFILQINGVNQVEEGCSIVLTHNFEDEIDEIIWQSSDNEILEVIDGVVIGKKEGKACVYLQVNQHNASIEITVIKNIVEVTINGRNILYPGDSCLFDVTLSKEVDDIIIWESMDPSILDVSSEGVVTAKKAGETYVKATLSKSQNFGVFKVLVKDKEITYDEIIVSGENKVEKGKKIKLTINYSTASVTFKSMDENILKVTNLGIVTGISSGKTNVLITLKNNENVYTLFEIEVIKIGPDEIIIHGANSIVQGEHTNLSVDVIGENVSKEVVFSSSDETILGVYQGIVQGIKPGEAYIYATSKVDKNVYGSIKIKVTKYEAEKVNDSDLKIVNEILNKMTLNQKVGQMFCVGFSGTSFTSSLSNAIDEYNFGNVIYMGANVSNPTTIAKMSNDIQDKMVSSNLVPGFISIDQEGGRVVRLTNGGTHFVSNMTICATNDYHNAYLEGVAVGKELKNYGINSNFAPVLDVNNNPENPIIGIRSYSDNPLRVSLFGKNMFKGLKDSFVMGCSKHFPGHGNTSVDSHYGLPSVTSSKEELYQTELAPFISAVTNGIDAIMTTHIIFTAIDEDYPATLSYKVLTNLLREELGYDGLIITDGMEMKAVTSNFGGYGDTAIKAIKAGVDILLYTSTTNPKTAHKAVLEAVNNQEISIERINESVRRILLKKLKYGLLDDYYAKNEDISNMLAEHETLNNKFAEDSVTKVIGDFSGLDRTKSTLIISPTSSYNLGSGLSSNSFANYACNYLLSLGHEKVNYVTVSNNISATDAATLLNKAQKYDQIVVAFSNVKTSNYTNTATFVNNLALLGKELIVISLDTPYDLMVYSENVKNYICVYGYQKATVIALAKYLNGEFVARGVLSIKEEVFK